MNRYKLVLLHIVGITSVALTSAYIATPKENRPKISDLMYKIKGKCCNTKDE